MDTHKVPELLRERVGKVGSHYNHEYRCACGKIFVARGFDVKRGDTQSCGCFQRRRTRETHLKYVVPTKGNWGPFLTSLPVTATGCIEWPGFKDTWGYGRIGFNGKMRGTHRVSYELTKGPIPKGRFVCHSCDNPACINPEHLWLGTHKDNMKDRANKGRTANRFGKPFSQAQRRLIGRMAQTQPVSLVCKMFGVGHTTVYRFKKEYAGIKEKERC